MIRLFLSAALLFAGPAMAEKTSYRAVELTGLSRDASWNLNPPGLTNAMVCNVNGSEGFLSVRDGPGTGHKITRKLKRLAVVVLNTGQRQGHWVRVTRAFRYNDSNGNPIPYQELPVAGWAHDGYLCDFLD